MKKFGFILIFLLSVISTTYAYQNQGFNSYIEEPDGSISFQCETQCFALVGDKSLGDYIYLKGTVEGNGVMGYGFMQGQQIFPGNLIQINQTSNIDQQMKFSESPYISQLPNGINTQIVLVIQGNIKGKILPQLGELGLWGTIREGVNQALTYKSYNPRTINFLEGPTWNGKYINQYFIKIIVILLIIAIVSYLFSSTNKGKKKSVYFGIGVFVFFWMFFDFFSTVNEFKIYKDITKATNIMDNGRLGKESDFYQFIDFIKTQVPEGERGYFIAPYPFSFEGTYHAYPNIKIGLLTGSNYLFFYNPYGTNNPFGFADPLYSSGVIERNDLSFNVEKEISRKQYAKIYILKK